MATCPNMKKTTLEKMLENLETEASEVKVPEEIARRAMIPIERMMAIQGIYAAEERKEVSREGFVEEKEILSPFPLHAPLQERQFQEGTVQKKLAERELVPT